MPVSDGYADVCREEAPMEPDRQRCRVIQIQDHSSPGHLPGVYSQTTGRAGNFSHIAKRLHAKGVCLVAAALNAFTPAAKRLAMRLRNLHG